MAVNAVTVWGVFGAQWTVATGIALYWSENVIGIALIALLFVVHRLATHKRGHNRRVLHDFLQVTIPFTIGHGIFLAVILLLLFPKIARSETFQPRDFLLG